MKRHEKRVKIFFSIIESNKPLGMSEIARATAMRIEDVNYHLPILIELGLVLPVEDKKYMPQLFFVDEDDMDESYKLMEVIAHKIAKELITEHAESPEDALINNLQMFALKFAVDIDPMRETSQ